ncbi:hypothetical protein PGT21_009645 [Puccinia graminis f. sp. tritici]|uniref:Uncharacterized protein n=1 Tax=Puccinia graminis f. sp. tritici TaxID=56615 RepID=A0A5B0RHD6_PUCGR|nr:hypothetical protein PGT21_009645 [Puccinia graminis f. sp. tritici]KAA1124882.1 hypothetical protein PGTUg99_036383 [Puccinia graminis f. sp. tritici]
MAEAQQVTKIFQEMEGAESQFLAPKRTHTLAIHRLKDLFDARKLCHKSRHAWATKGKVPNVI